MKVSFAGRFKVKMIPFYVVACGFDIFPGKCLKWSANDFPFLNITIKQFNI